MRQRYVVFHEGKPIGWVHAATAEEAIKKVCKVTGRPADHCSAMPCRVRNG